MNNNGYSIIKINKTYYEEVSFTRSLREYWSHFPLVITVPMKGLENLYEPKYFLDRPGAKKEIMEKPYLILPLNVSFIDYRSLLCH